MILILLLTSPSPFLSQIAKSLFTADPCHKTLTFLSEYWTKIKVKDLSPLIHNPSPEPLPVSVEVWEEDEEGEKGGEGRERVMEVLSLSSVLFEAKEWLVTVMSGLLFLLFYVIFVFI